MVATTHRQGNNKEHVLAQLDQFITILHYTEVHRMLIRKMAQGPQSFEIVGYKMLIQR